MGRAVAALILLALSARTAHADSDGYFCIGPNYLAVQFRSFNTPGLSGPHVLKIARFDGARGPRWAGEVVLEDFQPHGMKCEPDAVTIEGWSDDYVVGLDSSLTPRLHARVKRRSRSAPRSPQTNLGGWSTNGVTPMPTTGTRRVQLRIGRRSRSITGGIQHLITSELEELDASGRVTRSLRLYQGEFFEPIH